MATWRTVCHVCSPVELAAMHCCYVNWCAPAWTRARSHAVRMSGDLRAIGNFARPRRSGSSNGSRPAPPGTSNSPSNPEFFIGITWEWGQTEQLATFGELVDHEVTTGCFEEPIEMRASRHRRDAFYIGDHEVPSR